MQLDVPVDTLMKAKSSLTRYRDTGFAAAQASAGYICEETNVEAVWLNVVVWIPPLRH